VKLSLRSETVDGNLSMRYFASIEDYGLSREVSGATCADAARRLISELRSTADQAERDFARIFKRNES